MSKPALPHGIAFAAGGVRIVVTWPAVVLLLAVSAVALALRLPLALLAVAVTVVALFGHELGHCLSARRHGLEVLGIAVKPVGAASYLWGPVTDGRTRRKISSAGPLASLVLAGLGAIVFWQGQGRLASTAGLLVALINLLVALVNLLPVRPCDGSRILTGLLWQLLGSETRAQRLLSRVEAGMFGLIAAVAGALVVTGARVAGGEAVLFALVLASQRQLALRDQARAVRGS